MKGFSLLEVLIASFIVVVGFTAVLGLSVTSVANLSAARQFVIASNLAQEGVEYIHNLRDQCFLEKCSSWLDKFNFNNQGQDTICYGKINPSANQLSDFKHGAQCKDQNVMKDAPPLKLASDGHYNYANGIDTTFTREVILDRISDNEIRVTSWVEGSWRGHIFDIRAEDHLFNWH